MPDWVRDVDFTGWEVNREGDYVFLILSNEEGAVVEFPLSPTDALDIGTALAQAGFTPNFEEEENL